MITVILATAARATLLRMALQSVVLQTAVRKIDRVIVSENGSDRASQEICREFPQLPITYVFREPALKPLEHGQALMKDYLQGDITCILHDDDSWLPNHLEDALAALQTNPEAAAYGADFIIYQEPDLLERYDLTAWFGANYPATTAVWQLSHADVLLATFFGLIVHYSSLVARTAALAQSAFVYDMDNSFDNDRMVLFALSRRGPVLFNPRISVVVRHHEIRETSTFNREERCRKMARTSEWMVESDGKQWPLIAAAFVKRLAQCPDEKKKMDLLGVAISRSWCLPEIARHLDRNTEREFFALYDQLEMKFRVASPSTPTA